MRTSLGTVHTSLSARSLPALTCHSALLRVCIHAQAQVGLAYIAQRGLPVVTKSSDPRYLAEDLDLFGADHFISAQDRQRIDQLTSPNCEMEAPGGCCHAT